MLYSIALIFLCGLLLGNIFKKLHLPSLIGMLLTGILLGPFALNLLSDSVLDLSQDLRKIALIIILTRAGLSLNINDLKKAGRPAFLLCFVPALLEIIAMSVFAPIFFDVNLLDAIIMGCVLAAVSPAVVVPKMIKLMDENYGTKKAIPQMIMAAASVDDVIVIVLFTAFTGLAKNHVMNAVAFLDIPISITLGVIVGVIIGLILQCIFKKVQIRDDVKVVLLLSISFLLVTLENTLNANHIGFSGLLAIMTMGITINTKSNKDAINLQGKFSSLWVASEILLFVLVGASVDISYALSQGISAVLLIFICLIFRMLAVLICTLKTNLNKKERLFCSIAYLPKATVQAAIGTLPLTMGLSCGNIVLTVAVIAILVTAPLGAFLIDLSYKKLLKKEA